MRRFQSALVPAVAALALALGGCAAIDPHNILSRGVRTSNADFQLNVLGEWGRSAAFDFVWDTINQNYVDPRFNGVDWTATESGAVFVHGATLWLECAPFKRIEAGDHEIVVLQIVALAMYPDVAPMVFHRSNFHELASTA